MIHKICLGSIKGIKTQPHTNPIKQTQTHKNTNTKPQAKTETRKYKNTHPFGKQWNVRYSVRSNPWYSERHVNTTFNHNSNVQYNARSHLGDAKHNVTATFTIPCAEPAIDTILLWSGVGGEPFDIILLWSGVGGQLLTPSCCGHGLVVSYEHGPWKNPRPRFREKRQQHREKQKMSWFKFRVKSRSRLTSICGVFTLSSPL